MQSKKILIGGISAYNEQTGTFQDTTADQLQDLFQKNNIPFVFTGYYQNKLVSLFKAIETTWRHRNEFDIAILPLFGTYNSLLWQKALSRVLQLLHKKIILVVHGGSIPEQLKTNPGKFLSSLHRAHAIVAPSGFMQHALQHFTAKTVIIENVINISDYLFHAKKIIRPKLVWMRSFSDIYNPQMAVKVAVQLSKKYPDFKMIMAGADKGLLPQVKTMIKENGLEEKIDIPGYIDIVTKNKIAGEYDIYICTNKIDNAPVSIIEFMSLGLPVVSVKTGGIPYMIEDNVNGCLVEPDDHSAMAEKIEALINNNTLQEGIINRARTYAEKYDEKNVLEKWSDLFNTLRA